MDTVGALRLIREAQQALARPVTRPYQASAIAVKLFLLSEVHGLRGDERLVHLVQNFEQALHRAGLEDVLVHQLRYASDLSKAPGVLQYEEIHKLLSLCDEIHALRSLGHIAAEELLQGFVTNVRARFARQRKQATLAAEDKAEDWNRQFWWYAENLEHRIG